jgi:hypothetical protein
MIDDTEELYFWLTNQPTIAEVRRLNRDALLGWPLSLLIALVDGGVDLDAQSDAVLKQVVIEGPDCIDMRIRARDRNGKLLADLGVDGDGEYFPFWRRWCPECRARERCPNCTGSFEVGR